YGSGEDVVRVKLAQLPVGDAILCREAVEAWLRRELDGGFRNTISVEHGPPHGVRRICREGRVSRRPCMDGHHERGAHDRDGLVITGPCTAATARCGASLSGDADAE